MPNRLYNKQVTPKGYQKGGAVKKPKVRKIMAGGVGKAKDYPGIKEIIKMNKQGKKRFGMKMGGALKPVNPKTQKGLSKLPTEVRNKMGYMQEGGAVKDKPGKNIVLGKTYHPITENAMRNNILKNFSGNKKFASVGDLQDRHKEIKEKFFAKGVKPSEIKKLDKEFNSRLISAKKDARKILANRPGMKSYRKKQQKAKAIDTGSEN